MLLIRPEQARKPTGVFVYMCKVVNKVDVVGKAGDVSFADEFKKGENKMATVSFMTLVTDVRKRMGNVVFSKWKDTNYVREYVRHNPSATEKQLEVRKAFSLLVSLWRSMEGTIMQASWDNHSRALNMTGFNAFLGQNSNSLRKGEPLGLFREFGENAPASFTAAAGSSGNIVCTFAMPAGPAGKHVIFFAQKIVDGEGGPEITMYEAGANTASPFTISGLEPGATYFVYAVVTDNAYANAITVSASVSASASAGV
jgi:hypothetical protein